MCRATRLTSRHQVNVRHRVKITISDFYETMLPVSGSLQTQRGIMKLSTAFDVNGRRNPAFSASARSIRGSRQVAVNYLYLYCALIEYDQTCTYMALFKLRFISLM